MTKNSVNDATDTLTIETLDLISGGQQVFKHQFAGAVNQMTGLRSFEPTFAAAVADGTLPDPKG